MGAFRVGLRGLAWAILWSAGTTRLAAEEFPYQAELTVDSAALRSGPGEHYYPAAQLSRGETVEVYRHDPGGWYAVRPPQGSFSWLRASDVELIDQDLAEIKAERTPVRVGSQLDNTRDVIQVYLDPGEQVRVLGVKRFGSGPNAETWYQIAPPAGEFRWVHGRFVARRAEWDGVASSRRAAEREPVAARRAGRPEPESAAAEPGHYLPPRRPIELTSGGDSDDRADAEPSDEATDDALADDALADDTPADERASDAAEDDLFADEAAGPPEPLAPQEWSDDDPRAEDDEPAPRERRRRGDPLDEAQGDSRERSERRRVRDDRSVGDPSDDEENRSDYEADVPTAEDEEPSDGDIEASPRRPPRGRMATLDPEQRPRSPRSQRERARGDERDDDDDSADERLAGDGRGSTGSGQIPIRLAPLPERLGGRDLENLLDELDLAISAVVADDPARWNLKPLEDRVEALLALAEKPSDRGQVRLMVRKIERFRELHEATLATLDPAADNAPADEPPPGLAGGPRRATDDKFDGRGRLTRVVTGKRGDPSFALLDAQGVVRCYVTPAPGMNLRYYVGREVGIAGSLGYWPEMNTQHLVAQRVTVLDDGTTRR